MFAQSYIKTKQIANKYTPPFNRPNLPLEKPYLPLERPYARCESSEWGAPPLWKFESLNVWKFESLKVWIVGVMGFPALMGPSKGQIGPFKGSEGGIYGAIFQILGFSVGRVTRFSPGWFRRSSCSSEMVSSEFLFVGVLVRRNSCSSERVSPGWFRRVGDGFHSL